MNYNIVIIISVIWLVINVLNVLLRSLIAYEFSQVLQSLGLTLRPIQILFKTQSFNRLFYLLSNWRPKLINKWFAVGTAVTLLAVIPSFYLILYTIYQYLISNVIDSNKGSAKTQALYPVIPGINLPMSDFIYYFISLAISSIYHETGHALAALREGVRLHSFGLFLFIIIPGAFVDLSTEQVLSLNVWNQLKIFTAGVWHNISLSLFTIVLLLINPIILSPFYTLPNGAVVAHIDPYSGAAGVSGLRATDLIIGIEDCKITETSNWKHCLLLIANSPRDGYCVDNEFVDKEGSFGLKLNECCDESSDKSLCFVKLSATIAKVCLPVRPLLDTSTHTCNTSNDCDKKSVCVKPHAEHNSTKLVRIRRQGKPTVLFWGSPSELYQSVVLVKYKPKLTYLPLLAIHYYETLLRYIISFSLALAVFNVIPCVYLDGQWITNAFIELSLKNKVSQHKKRLISRVVTAVGTVSLTTCIVLGLYQLFRA